MNNIENMQYPYPDKEYKVLVRCFTYNQSTYIENALNGFAMQKTNFPFVCLIMDDASTDGEQEVIKRWIECECDLNKSQNIDIPTARVIIIPHKTNLSCMFAFYLLKQNLYGTGRKKFNHVFPWRDKVKYEAICEGDDCWINPYKLQKQVDYLEKHKDCMLCFHNAFINNLNNPSKSNLFFRFNKGKYNSGDIIRKPWFIPTASILYRVIEREIELNMPKEFYAYRGGDIRLILYLSKYGYIFGFDDVMSIYNFGVKGCATFESDSQINDLRTYIKFISDINKKFFNSKFILSVFIRKARYTISLIKWKFNRSKLLIKAK